MSKFRLLATALLVALCTGFYSCSEEADSPINEPQINSPETYTVSFKLGGDFLTTSEMPLARTSEKPIKKIYGINVYYKKSDKDEYRNYGYGLFDNVEDMIISLITGYKYKFECTVVKEDKDKLKQTESGYQAPFLNGSYIAEFPTPLENKFIISTISPIYFPNLKLGTSNVIDAPYNNSLSYPKLERYYGELTDYIPSSNSKINIDLKRTSFGIKFVVTPPSDGTLSIDNYDIDTHINISSNDTKLETEAIYTFYYVYDCWKASNYTEKKVLYLNWNRANGATQTFERSITIKRNIMTTVNINITGASTDSSLGFNEEDTPMGDEKVDINIDGGNQEEIPVNPSV